MSQEWNIQACGQVCHAEGRPFADGEPIYSRLSFSEQGYQRADFCEKCWTDESRREAISYWRGVFHAPPPVRADPLKKENVETLLRQYMALEDFSRPHILYLLAVMLERKRLLVERDVHTRPDGMRMRIYEHRKTGEIFTVPDPGLKLGELEHIQTEIAELLGLPPRTDPPPAAVAPAPAEDLP